MKLLLFTIATAIVLPFQTLARTCHDHHIEARAIAAAKYVKASESEVAAWDKQLSEYSANVEEGLGVRAFFGNKVPKNAITEKLAVKHGLVWWRMRIYLVDSVEAAIEHRAKIRAFHVEKGTLPTDITAAPVYMIGKEAELGVKFSAETPMPKVEQAAMEKLMERQAFEVDENGQVTLYSAERFKNIVTPDGFFLLDLKAVPDAFGMNGLTKEGWVAFKQHGIHDYNHWKGSSTANKLRKLSIKLAEQGFTVRFNHDYRACMDMILKQERSYKTENGRSTHSAATNRYMNAVNRELMLWKLEKGEGYSVEVYSPEGKLVGGEIGVRDGNHYYGDTVFYDTSYNRKEHGFDGVDLAKVAADALFEVLGVRGQPYSDPGMITPYTASLGAELIPFREWFTKIKSGPEQPVLLPSTWSPLGVEYYQKVFGELAKRRNQGIGRNLVLARATDLEKRNQAIAEQAKVYLGTQKFVFVKTLEEAQTLAAQVTGQMPIYLIMPDRLLPIILSTPSIPKEIEMVTFKNPRYVSDVIRLDQEKDQLGLQTLKDSDMSVDLQTENPSFTIEVWQLIR